MRILYVVQNYYPSLGGTQVLFQNIAERCLTYYGDEGTVLSTNSYFGPDKKVFKKIDKHFEIINGISVYRFHFFRFHKGPFSNLMFLLRRLHIPEPSFLPLYRTGPWSPSLIHAMCNKEADVILASSSNYLYMLYPLFRSKLKSPKPFVFQGAVHFSEDENHKVFHQKTLDAIKASEYYLANTSFEKERLVKLGIDANMIIVTGVAVDMEAYTIGNGEHFRQLFGVSNDAILVGYIGRIESTKGIISLLEAVQIARQVNKELHLVVAGAKSAYAAELESYANMLKLHVHYLYNLSNQDKVSLYHSLDIFVLPSINESFGIVILEAWSCKKPVIGTNIGAIRSVISDGVDGLLMEPGNAKSLSEKILLLANNKEMRTTFGINGFNKTAENYTWPVVTKKYRDVLAMAINKFNVQRRSNMD